MQPEYIFIVGLPRTGTKLMMNILENSRQKRCFIAPENFFLGRAFRAGVRQKMKKIGNLSVDANVYKLVEVMYSGKFYGAYWDGLANGSLGIDREMLQQRILNSDRSDKSIYSILLQIRADIVEDEITNNIIWGDKTGPHLYHVPTLLEWFPEAKIIHTFRDPRAVLASEHKKLHQKLQRQIGKSEKAGDKLKAVWLRLNGPFLSLTIVLYVTIAWLYAAKLHYKYKKLYPNNYYLSKFEDLVNEPIYNVKRLCEFLDLEFHPNMLNPPKIDSSYSREGGLGFDTQTLNRWQNYLKPWMKAWLLLWGRKYLREFGYLS